MKKLFLLLVTAFTLSCCYKDNPPSKPLTEADKLPPATQIGANRLGCLLDGKAFMPGSYNNSRNCFYQYYDGKYSFAVSLNNRDSKNNITSLLVGAHRQIFQDETYPLYEFEEGNASGMYEYGYDDPVYTSKTQTGELKISKLDPVSGIVSGTFWYDVEDQNGIIHQIREGRFDMHYTN